MSPKSLFSNRGVVSGQKRIIPPSGGLLPYSPPTLSNPTTLTLTNPGTYTLTGGDYIIDQTSPIAVTGGTTCVDLAGSARHIVWIGGDLSATPLAGGDTANGLVIRGNFTGTLHFEGIGIRRAADAGIGLQPADSAIVQFQNMYVRSASYRDIQEPVHTDVIQCWSGPQEVRIHNMTGWTNRQGQLWMTTTSRYPQKVVQSNSDTHASPPQPDSVQSSLPTIAGALIWFVDRSTIFQGELWMDTGWYNSSYHRSIIDSMGGWSNGDGTYTDPANTYYNPNGTAWNSVVKQGDYVVVNEGNVNMTLRQGVPPVPGGEFCPLSSVGVNYVSPGYI